MWYHWATHLACNFGGRFHWLPYPSLNRHNMESPDLTCTTHLPCQWHLIIPAAPNIVHAIPKCASTVKAMPEARRGCSRATGASQNECPQHHSADMAESGCSQSRSWVSDGVAGLASHSDCTAKKMATTVNFMLHYVTWIIHRHNIIIHRHNIICVHRILEHIFHRSVSKSHKALTFSFTCTRQHLWTQDLSNNRRIL